MKRTYQPNNRRRKRTHGFLVRMRTRSGRAPCFRRAGARAQKTLGVNSGPAVAGDLLPGRPPSKAKRIRRVLRLRGPRVRTPSPAVSPARADDGRPRRIWASRSESGSGGAVVAQPFAAAPARDLPAQPRSSSGRALEIVVNVASVRGVHAAFSGARQDYLALDAGSRGCRARGREPGARGAVALLDFYKRAISPWLPPRLPVRADLLRSTPARRSRGTASRRGCVWPSRRLLRCHPVPRRAASTRFRDT